MENQDQAQIPKKPGVNYFDDQICEDSTLSSMMTISDIGGGELRFDCTGCFNRYKHHTSLFRHFRGSHPKEYEKKVALREQIKAEQARAKELGLPYLRRRNKKRKINKCNGEEASSSGASHSQEGTNEEEKASSESYSHTVKDLEQVSGASLVFVCEACDQKFDSHVELEEHNSTCPIDPSILFQNTGAEFLPDLRDELEEDLKFIPCPYDCHLLFQDYDSILGHLNGFHRQFWFNAFDNFKDLLGLDFLYKDTEPVFYCGVCNVANVDLHSIPKHECLEE